MIHRVLVPGAARVLTLGATLPGVAKADELSAANAIVLNRAFAAEKWAGYVSALHVVTSANIQHDGGPSNIFDPDNAYREHCKKIWIAQ